MRKIKRKISLLTVTIVSIASFSVNMDVATGQGSRRVGGNIGGYHKSRQIVVN